MRKASRAVYELCHVGRSTATTHVRNQSELKTYCGKPASLIISTTSRTEIGSRVTCKTCLAGWTARSRRARAKRLQRLRAVLVLGVGGTVAIGFYVGLWLFLYSNPESFSGRGPVVRILLVSFSAALIPFAVVVGILIPLLLVFSGSYGRSGFPEDYGDVEWGDSDVSESGEFDLDD